MAASYEKPAIAYWTAEELNSIQASMSGGGGGGASSRLKREVSRNANQTIKYQGRSKALQFTSLIQTASLHCSCYRIDGDRSVKEYGDGDFVHYEVSIDAECKAFRALSKGYADADILSRATLYAYLRGDFVADFYREKKGDAYSSPPAIGFDAEGQSMDPDQAELLDDALVAATPGGGLTRWISAASGRPRQSWGARDCFHEFDYGSKLVSNFKQKLHLYFAASAFHTQVDLCVEYYAAGETPQSEFIALQCKIPLYGKQKQ